MFAREVCVKSSHLNIQLICQWEANKKTVLPLKYQLIQLRRPSFSSSIHPLHGCCWHHRAALANGLVYSSQQGCLLVMQQGIRDPAAPPNKAIKTCHFFSFLFARPHTTPFSPSGQLNCVVIASGHSAPDPP